MDTSDIDPVEVKAKLDRHDSFVLLDVREPHEKVRNMKGGILAWSDKVDPTVPKY